MRNFIITDKQISEIHNAMCQMYYLNDTLNDMFKPDSVLLQRFNDAFNKLKPVRDELMKLKDDHDDEIREQADQYAMNNKFKYTRWSIYDIDSLLNTSNVPAGAKIVAPYESKESVVVEGYEGKVSWLDLWKAVEELARRTKWDEERNGFGDHVFIEKFTKVKDKEDTYEVWLGS